MTPTQEQFTEQFTGAWNDTSRGISKGLRASFLLLAVVFEGLSLGCVAVNRWLLKGDTHEAGETVPERQPCA